MLLQLSFEAFEQRESISSGAGKSGNDAVLVEPAYFAGIGFHDGVTQRDLAVATHDNQVAPADRTDRGAAKIFHFWLLYLHAGKSGDSGQGMQGVWDFSYTIAITTAESG